MKPFTKYIKLCFALFFLIFISCNEEYLPVQEDGILETQDKIFKLPDPKIRLQDSLLKVILKKELDILYNNKQTPEYQSRSMVVDKTNAKKVYVHYLPWYQSKDYDGYWGQHWTMTNKDPDLLDENGLNQIASFYNPLIGPYSSSDPYLQEYHFLLMKLCGIDGVIFDWYGSRDMHDYNLIKNATETFIPKLNNIDIDFSIMYEDRVAFMEEDGVVVDHVARAKQDLSYIRDQYFPNNNYLEFNGNKIISMFGPHNITNASDWDNIYSVFDNFEQPELISLWGLQQNLGNHFGGEFLWVAPDHLSAQDYYYQTYANTNDITIGSAYPGFSSYYTAGGWLQGSNDWTLPVNDGDTFIEVLNNNAHEVSDFVQIITWNDFGEGTMIEPTTQHGFMFLEILQEYTGVSFDADDLAVVVRLYKARQEHKTNTEVMGLLDNSYNYLKSLDVSRVDGILQAIDVFY